MTKRKKTGPVPPPGGRVRITVNLPLALRPVVDALEGRSQSDKIVGLIQRDWDDRLAAAHESSQQ